MSSPPPEVAPLVHVGGGGPATDAPAGSEHLFGRSLLFVVVSSVQLVVSTLVSPVLAYTLGPGGLGLLSSAIALHQVLVVLAVIGFDQALVLQRAQGGGDRAARGLITSGIVVSGLLTVALIAAGPFWARWLGFDSFDTLLIATVLWTAPAATVVLVQALLNGQDRLRAFAIVTALSTAGSQLVGLVLVFTLSRTAATYAWGGVVGQLAATVVGLALVRPRRLARADVPLLRTSLRLGVPLMLSALSVFVLNSGDRLVIQRVLGADEAGRYQVAYTIGSMGLLLLGMTGSAWASRIAEVRDDRARWALIGTSRDALLAMVAPTVLGLTLGAPLLLRVLAPSSFEPSTLLVVVFCVAISSIPSTAVLASTRALVTMRRTRPIAMAALVAAVLNLALNIALVPHLGITGSAAATTVSFTVQAGVQRLALRQGLPWPRWPARLVVALAASVAVAALSLLLTQDAVGIAVRTVAAAACLPWLLVALRRARRGPGPSTRQA